MPRAHVRLFRVRAAPGIPPNPLCFQHISHCRFNKCCRSVLKGTGPTMELTSDLALVSALPPSLMDALAPPTGIEIDFGIPFIIEFISCFRFL